LRSDNLCIVSDLAAAEGGGPLASLNHQAIPAKAEAEGQTEELKISLKARGGGRVGRGGAG